MTDPLQPKGGLSGPGANVGGQSRSLLWMLIAVVATVVVLGVLAAQCSPANSNAPVVTSVPADG